MRALGETECVAGGSLCLVNHGGVTERGSFLGSGEHSVAISASDTLGCALFGAGRILCGDYVEICVEADVALNVAALFADHAVIIVPCGEDFFIFRIAAGAIAVTLTTLGAGGLLYNLPLAKGMDVLLVLILVLILTGVNVLRRVILTAGHKHAEQSKHRERKRDYSFHFLLLYLNEDINIIPPITAHFNIYPKF